MLLDGLWRRSPHKTFSVMGRLEVEDVKLVAVASLSKPETLSSLSFVLQQTVWFLAVRLATHAEAAGTLVSGSSGHTLIAC